VKITISIKRGPRLTSVGSTLLSTATGYSVGQASGLTVAASLCLAVATTYGNLAAFLTGPRS
jgi:hypothetical protein